MSDLDVNEIHGYRAHLGYRVFTDAALPAAEQRASTTKLTASAENGEA